MKVTIKGWIHAHKEFDINTMKDVLGYTFFGFKTEDSGYIPVMPYEITTEIPDDFNMTAAMVQSLEGKKAQLRDEFNKRIASINEQISKLQALPYVPAEVL